MKCLCCNRKFEDKKILIQRYIGDHNVDRNNHFFCRLFLPDRHFQARKCFRCEAFFVTEREGKVHNFLRHYQHGGSFPAEIKPIKKTRFDQYLKKYSISFNEHSDYYNFENTIETIEDFMNVFEQNFRGEHGKKTLFKCSFVIINYQPLPGQSVIAIEDSRSWCTPVYQGVYFNEYIKKV